MCHTVPPIRQHLENLLTKAGREIGKRVGHGINRGKPTPQEGESRRKEIQLEKNILHKIKSSKMRGPMKVVAREENT